MQAPGQAPSELTPEVLTYHDSWISLDPVVGCPYDCRYCVLQLAGRTRQVPTVVCAPSHVLDRLEASRYFVRGKTVLSYGNTTDAFFGKNVAYTLAFLGELEARGIDNPIAIPTKSPVTQEVADQIRSLRHPRVLVYLSYSGLPDTLERGVERSCIERSFKVLSATGIPTIHFWRPLVPLNTSDKEIRDRLRYVSGYANASVAVGLKYTPELRRAFAEDPRLRVEGNNLKEYGEWLPSHVEERLWRIARGEFPGYPIFRHTSCSVSYVLGVPDYNATVYRPDVCRKSTCPDFQRRICERAARKPSAGDVALLLDRLGLDVPFTIHDYEIAIDAELTQQDYVFLLHNLNYPIRANVRFTEVWRGSIFRWNTDGPSGDG